MESKRQEPPIYRFAYILAIILLTINCAGAIYGGYGLTAHPDGASIGLDLQLLRRTPFTSYFLPGIVLILLNGVMDFAVLLATIFRVQAFYRYVVLQGLALVLWLAIQVMLIRTFDKMHLIMTTIGVLMIVCGRLLAKQRNRRMAALSRIYSAG